MLKKSMKISSFVENLLEFKLKHNFFNQNEQISVLFANTLKVDFSQEKNKSSFILWNIKKLTS